MLDALPAAHHQLLGHGLATEALRAAGARQVAIANNCSPVWPASDRPADVAAAAAYDTLHNRMFTDPLLLGRYPDLSAFGVGEAGLDCVRDGDLAVIAAPMDAPRHQLLQPDPGVGAAGLAPPVPAGADPRLPGYRVRLAGGPGRADRAAHPARRPLRRRAAADLHHRERLLGADEPAADGTLDDQPRIRYLDGHLRALADADHGRRGRARLPDLVADRQLRVGEGYDQRFGLVHVDFATQARTPRARSPGTAT